MNKVTYYTNSKLYRKDINNVFALQLVTAVAITLDV